MHKIVFIIYIISALGCVMDKENDALLPEINIEKNLSNLKPLQLSDFVSNVNYITLDKDPILFRQIYQVDFSKEMILVRDLDNNVLYDMCGNYVNKIGSKGRGPGEYTYIRNSKIGSNDNIYIHDTRSIMVYNLNGNYIRKFNPELNADYTVFSEHKNELIHMKVEVSSWSFYNDSLFFGQIPNYTGNQEYKAILFNDRGKIIKKFRNWIFLNRERPLFSEREGNANIVQYRGNTYFKEIINDTLFVINDQLFLEPIYYFNLGMYAEPIENRELDLRSESRKSIDNYIFINNIFITPNYFFLDCYLGKHSPAKRQEQVEMSGIFSEFYTRNVLGVYNKTSGELIFTQPTPIDNHFLNKGLYNDVDGGLNFYPKERVNDSTLAMWIDAYILKNHVASEAFKNFTPKYPEKKKQLEELASRLDENDNPVLMLVKLKE